MMGNRKIGAKTTGISLGSSEQVLRGLYVYSQVRKKVGDLG
jgi:hypothetical protein